MVAWARERGAVVASDECYIDLGWDAAPVSVLHPDVCGGSAQGLLAVHSLSKRSNLAGYRAGFLAGDPALVAELLEVRRHAGMIDARPGAGGDGRRARRRQARGRAEGALPRPARPAARGAGAAGFRIDHSEAGLYLWASRPGRTAGTRSGRWPARASSPPPASSTARRRGHIRVALTATDERIAAAVGRLAQLAKTGATRVKL